MTGVTKSAEKWNAREQLLSADMMRSQALASRDDQDLEAARSESLDSSVPNPGNSTHLLGTIGSRIYGVNKPPTWTPAAGFTATIGAGSGYVDYPAFPSLTSDDSSYLTVRWDAATLTFANPPGANQRIDVVVATPAMSDADLQSRVILVDPVTRSVTPQNVFKTVNPTAALSVVTGTAGATPAVPAIPAGSLPLFYVWVPSGAATASRFAACRASWRRAVYPLASMAGVVNGGGCRWDLAADSAAADSKLTLTGFNRVIIDGEVLEWASTIDSTVGIGVRPDTANNPFGGAAPASWHQPYYLYLVGGRHNPMPSFNATEEGSVNGSGLAPVTLVESLTPPVPTSGKASANLTVNGLTVTPDGTVYIGLGFVAANTTRRLACMMDDTLTTFGTPNAKNKVSLNKAGAGVESVGTPLSKPSISERALVTARYQSGDTATVKTMGLLPDNGTGGANAPTFNAIDAARLPAILSAGAGEASGILQWSGGGSAPATVWVIGGVATDTITVIFQGYDHRVKKFGPMANP